MKKNIIIKQKQHNTGFTLVEVVLAIGVLGIAVLALLGMFAPTMNNVKNVLDSDFAASSTSYISDYFERMATEDFTGIEDLIGTATATSPSETALYLYMRSTRNADEVYVGQDIDMVQEDLIGDNIRGVVLRTNTYLMPSSEGDEFDYTDIGQSPYVPIIIKIFSVEAHNPSGPGNLLMTYALAINR